MNYKIIDAYQNGCILYHKDKEFLSSCPKPGCGLSRYIEGSNSIPAKIIRWFPLIPRLSRMWRSTTISKLLKYHTDNLNKDRTIMKSVANSPAWKHVKTHVDPSFLLESRNMRFGLTLDGINSFCHNNTQHNT